VQRWKPGPVVVAVFISGMLGVWVVAALWIFYNVLLEPLDVALNMVIFMTATGWWTDHLGRS
jgi:hypothetical protein